MIGYIASALVLFTFAAKDMRMLRTAAILSNIAFITYGAIAWLPPVLFLHLVLLPLNIVRLAEVVRATRSTSDLPQPDGVMGVQTLGADMTWRNQLPLARWLGYDPNHSRVPKLNIVHMQDTSASATAPNCRSSHHGVLRQITRRISRRPSLEGNLGGASP
jgi:hypothetical protein